MYMYPSIVGKGPFQPSIITPDGRYVYNIDFESEQQAYARAHEMYKELERLIRDELHANRYQFKG